MDEESTEPFSKEQYKNILQDYERHLKQADIVCLQDYNKGLLSTELCIKMIRLAKQAGKKVIVDPPLISDYLKFRGATLVKPNRKEASFAVGFEIKTTDDAERAATIIAKKLRSEAVVITLDKLGSFL